MTHPLIDRPLPDLAGWVEHFRRAEIPVLADTADTIAAYATVEDSMDARTLTEVIAVDPLMTLKLLAHTGQHRHAGANADVETVTGALVMMGMAPFFRRFREQPTVDEWLQHDAAATAGLRAVLKRADRGARFALGFAVHRADPAAAVIHEAALLHDFVEMLLWCHAPVLALRMQERLRGDPALRSKAVQQEVLNVAIDDLQHALMLAWRLPALLVQITHDRQAVQSRVKTVLLGIRVARHTTQGWDNAALPDDIKDIAALLNLSPAATLQLLHDIDD